jgi:hypothetical protein
LQFGDYLLHVHHPHEIASTLRLAILADFIDSMQLKHTIMQRLLQMMHSLLRLGTSQRCRTKP